MNINFVTGNKLKFDIASAYFAPLSQLSHEDQVAFWGDGRWPDVVNYLQEHQVEHVL